MCSFSASTKSTHPLPHSPAYFRFTPNIYPTSSQDRQQTQAFGLPQLPLTVTPANPSPHLRFRCAGTCAYQRHGGCKILLSEPLLKFRPQSDLKATLLHEMIHACLFLTSSLRDREWVPPRPPFRQTALLRWQLVCLKSGHHTQECVSTHRIESVLFMLPAGTKY